MRVAVARAKTLAPLEAALGSVPNVGYGKGVSAGVAGEPFLVAHDLGVVPEWIDGIVGEDGYCWWTEADQKSWTAATVRLRCSAISARVFVRVESRRKGA